MAGQIMGTDISLRFNDLSRKIFPAYSPNQYFSQEIGGNFDGGAAVEGTGELYRHEKGDLLEIANPTFLHF
jgi:hypothetical protein